jgi:hypothetical protein
MNTAIFANADFFGPLQGLMRWWSASRFSAVGTPLPKREVQSFTPKLIAANDPLTRATGRKSIVPMPLRVVRVVETGQARTSVGRMVISGRMADVCAELDRLAAREAALS